MLKSREDIRSILCRKEVDMKRIGNLYEKICSIENIQRAITESARHKHKKKMVRRVLSKRDFYAKEIQKMLVSHDIKWGIDHYKTIVEPSSQKQRDITIPTYYPDQIIHWCIMLVITPYIKKGMIDACIGSVPGRGPLKGKKRCEKILKTDKKVKYIYKADVHHFFQSIRIGVMKKLLREDFKDPNLLELLDFILDKGSRGTGVGLPIGYYTSQWLSNYYLQKLDHYVIEKLRPRHYIRYVDDIVMFDSNKRRLHQIHKKIEEFLKDYGLEIKGNWQVYRKYSRPLDFLGYKFYDGYTKLRTRIFIHINRVINRLYKQSRKHIRTARSAASLLGWLKHTNRGLAYYKNYIKKIISKIYLKRLISTYDKGLRLQIA